MGEIVIRDESMGMSWVYQPTNTGYAEAYQKILEIVQAGHRVGGDVGRVQSFMGH